MTSPTPLPDPPALELHQVWAGYGQTTVLRGLSLHVPARSVVAVLGPNGVGKTTALRVASGVIRPAEGSVTVGGEDVTGATPSQLVARGLCHVPDPRGIFPSLTVQENLLLYAAPGDVDDATARAVDAFPRLGERLNQRAGTLSGGEQQMLAVARAYVQQPRVVLLDEVSMGLAPNLVDEIFEFLERVAAAGTALVLVEQFVHRALALADRVYVMARGTVQLTGRAAELTESEIFDAYAGLVHHREG